MLRPFAAEWRHAVNLLSLTTNLEVHKLRIQWPFLEVQARHRNRQVKSPRSGASRVDVQHAIAFRLSGFMRMAADDDAKTGCGWIQVQGVHIVQDVDQGLPWFRHGRLG